ncbi:type II toxin-antitoxin system VapC family toxin [Chenggangzhangella methanolivorans]|uniref:Ribonuclease VapC n=1 Tax=Chenggangzhangella methanolivorans TaxID=1437009 RepID=A0A9E6UG18_9HYPH|nr:type II toxin-antitoxin system VapC family toxin [Chenggangzhangella methanolivorans]QZN98292.1 type II toxin-antitoxin system VapC family toxin [Chenggangzhangella methanolivorans]
MIILDTNVLSEIMRPPGERSSAVFEWMRARNLADLATTSISVAEIAVGVHKMPSGRRRAELETGARRLFSTFFSDRIFSFDVPAAERFGPLLAERRRKGRHFHAFDFQILAIAASRGCAVATRNTRDFDQVGVALINPWDHPAA